MSGSALALRRGRHTRARTARWAAAVAFAVTAVALSLAPAASASAHDFLIGSSPAADSVQATPLNGVTLTFNDIVLNIGGSSSIVQVTDAAGAHFETGCAKTIDRTVSVPVALGKPGSYVITYQIVSADGHTVSAKVPFTYSPPPGTTAAAGSTQTRCGHAGAATDTAAPAAPSSAPTAAAPTAGSGSTDLGLVIGLAAGIAGLAIAAVVVLVITRKKPASPADDPTKSQ